MIIHKINQLIREYSIEKEINNAKKDIEDDLAVMLRDFNKINNKNSNGKYIYYGVSYIPFVYKLGALYGDQGIDVRFCQISRKMLLLF